MGSWANHDAGPLTLAEDGTGIRHLEGSIDFPFVKVIRRIDKEAACYLLTWTFVSCMQCWQE